MQTAIQTERQALDAAIDRANGIETGPANGVDQYGDLVFAQAVWWAAQARMWRRYKRDPVPGWPAGRCEARAREAERHVRDIALQSEIAVARRLDRCPKWGASC